ncbi:hypothetical protein OB920_10090 [Halobacteria archaeon HArc-gm2]|nr:hypothetical protein [Halobacteria archaeon HArc-gm2]
MDVTAGLLAAYVMVPLVPAVGTALTVVALSRPRVGIFTTDETVQTPFGYERYRFKSPNRRRALGVLLVAEFLVLTVLTVFAADAYLVTP